jgi:prefoldin subunit 5
MELNTRFQRLQNQVRDVSKSREKWRNETRQLEELFAQLQAENAALQDPSAGVRKGRRRKGPGPSPE